MSVTTAMQTILKVSQRGRKTGRLGDRETGRQADRETKRQRGTKQKYKSS